MKLRHVFHLVIPPHNTLWATWVVLYAAMDVRYTALKNNPLVLLYFQELVDYTRAWTYSTDGREGGVFLCCPDNKLVEEKGTWEETRSCSSVCWELIHKNTLEFPNSSWNLMFSVQLLGMRRENEHELHSEWFRYWEDYKCNTCMGSSASIMEDI